jgi:predicted TIM-barrel fold metal-dependent hydrolase
MGSAVTFLESAPLSEEERRKIAHVNAESMFDLSR